MKTFLLLHLAAVGLLGWSPTSNAAAVTLYFYNNGGGLGHVMQRAFFVDGKQFANMRSGQKVTIEVPLGKHTFRGTATEGTTVFRIDGDTVLKYGPNGWIEALVDKDPLLKAELDQTEAIPPSIAAP